jgi:glycosyltransferase involved in cell wall biosynthesis
MNSSLPLVSCTVIFLDAEKFLSEAVESVLAQTYENWELFLVNDGSSDASSAIALDYHSRYPEKIHFLEHKEGLNRGKNASRNLGIQHSKGEYIALLDADDVWLPAKLAEQVAIMENTLEAGMIYGRTQIWTSWAGASASQDGDSVFDLGVQPNTLIQPPLLVINLLEGWAQTPTTCNALIRSTVIDELGGFDEDFHEIFEDQIFFAKIELTYPVYVADAVWAKYRQHPASSFAQHSAARYEDRSGVYLAQLRFFDWLEHFLSEQSDKPRDVTDYLSKRKQSTQKKLAMVQRPVLGPLTVSILLATEQALGLAAKVGRRLLPAGLRDWLWVKFGKKVYTNL